MKLIILKDNLKEGLSRVERATGETSSLPILKHVLCEASGSVLKLSATNLELGIQTEVAAKVGEEGAITLPFQALYAIVQGSDADRITLETEENVLLVKTDNYNARVQGMSAEEFPIIPKLESEDASVSIPADIFTDAVRGVVYAAQLSEIRPELGGVLIDFQVTILKLVATDSFRLAERTILTKHLKTKIASGFKAIIPLKTMHEAERIFSKDSSITIAVDKNQVLISGEKTKLVSRLLSGAYPDYEQIIPKSSESSLTIEREKFMSAVRLVSTFSGKVNDIKVRMGKGAKVLEVYSATKDLGENSYLVPVKTEKGEFGEISFNWRYLMDGLKAMPSKEVLMELSGDAKPAVIKPAEDSSYLYLLMPIKAS